MKQQLQDIKVWLEKEYANINEKIYIDSVMGAIEDAIKQIKSKKLFDKRFSISKNISVLVYNSDTIEVHSAKLNNYKGFVKSNETKQSELPKLDQLKIEVSEALKLTDIEKLERIEEELTDKYDGYSDPMDMDESVFGMEIGKITKRIIDLETEPAYYNHSLQIEEAKKIHNRFKNLLKNLDMSVLQKNGLYNILDGKNEFIEILDTQRDEYIYVTNFKLFGVKYENQKTDEFKKQILETDMYKQYLSKYLFTDKEKTTLQEAANKNNMELEFHDKTYAKMVYIIRSEAKGEANSVKTLKMHDGEDINTLVEGIEKFRNKYPLKSAQNKINPKPNTEKTRFMYGLTQRPAGMGAVPGGFQIEALNGPRDLLRHGIISYEKELSDDELNKYEIINLSESHFNKTKDKLIETLVELYGEVWKEEVAGTKSSVEIIASEYSNFNYDMKIDPARINELINAVNMGINETLQEKSYLAENKILKKQERFGAGHMGGVDTVIWDTAIRENGDYKTVGTIMQGVADIKEEYLNNIDVLKFALKIGAYDFKKLDTINYDTVIDAMFQDNLNDLKNISTKEARKFLGATTFDKNLKAFLSVSQDKLDDMTIKELKETILLKMNEKETNDNVFDEVDKNLFASKKDKSIEATEMPTKKLKI